MKYFINQILIFLIPLYLIILSYFFLDPFKVLYTYNNYYSNTFIQLNRDHISTEHFLKTYKTSKYNAFKFGSSRTIAYNCNQWKSFLNNDSRPFSFDASNENITGIRYKFELIQNLNLNIDNALILFCPDVTFIDKNKEYWSMKHKVYDSNFLTYNLKFLLAYLNNGFFLRYVDYKLFERKDILNTAILNLSEISWDPNTNDFYPKELQEKIKKDSASYYQNKSIFYNREDSDQKSDHYVYGNNLNELVLISKILKKNKTNYKIIISPLYSQLKINNKDLLVIQHIFGESKVFDFSGKNQITEAKGNYLENSHYKRSVGNIILNKIYTNTK